MAEKVLSAERLAAGRDFFLALKKLGLYPDGLFWAFDDAVSEPALVLVTAFYDQVGPLEVNKLLFRAYNLAVTPKSISPFIIRLHSPEDEVAEFVDRFVAQWRQGFDFQERGAEGKAGWAISSPTNQALSGATVASVSIGGTSLHAFANGLYTWRRSPKIIGMMSRWAKIQSKVEKLAA